MALRQRGGGQLRDRRNATRLRLGRRAILPPATAAPDGIGQALANRLEDDAGLIESIQGSGDTGIIGLPIDVVRGLLAQAGFSPRG